MGLHIPNITCSTHSTIIAALIQKSWCLQLFCLVYNLWQPCQIYPQIPTHLDKKGPGNGFKTIATEVRGSNQ
jgi:hypothetical protein